MGHHFNKATGAAILGLLMTIPAIIAAQSVGLETSQSGTEEPEIILENISSIGGINPLDVEVDLGEYDVPVFQNDSNTSLTVFIHLFATLKPSDQSRFERQLDRSRARMRDSIIASVRSASRDDFYEPDITRLKTAIRRSVLRVIDNPHIRTIGFLSFYYAEQ